MSTNDFRRRRDAFPRAAQVAGLMGLLVLGLGLAAMATPHAAAAASPSAGNHFIGVEKCRNCHKADENGNQYAKWSKTWHAKAFETLGSDEARELAKAKGIDDPQKADACLKCHVTAAGAPAEALAKGFKPELGVQCESCHGQGEAHMKARLAAAAKGEGAAAKAAEDEINHKPNIDACLQCHNPASPTYRPFCYAEMHKLIMHLNPNKARSEEEMSALMNPFGCTDTACQCPKGSEAGAGGASGTSEGAGQEPKGG